jgi:hypothetical protein
MNGALFVFKLCVSSQSDTQARFVTFRKESVISKQKKKRFREDPILPELLSDNLSNVLEDIFQ